MMERVVEEIREYLHRKLLTIEKASQLRLDRHDLHAQTERLLAEATDTTHFLITRIGKAYADGELELPGGKGRGMVVGLSQHPFLISFDSKEFGKDIKLGDILIALRPLSGTGKEEK